MPGLPNRARASLSASTQNQVQKTPAASVCTLCQPPTLGSAGRLSCRAEGTDRPCVRDAACWCSASAGPPTARASASAAGRAGGRSKSPLATAPPEADGCRRLDRGGKSGRAASKGRAPPQIPAAAGNKSCCAQSPAARIAGLRTAPLPARSSPASQHSGDGGLPGKKIALDLQLPDLAVQIVDHLLRVIGRRPLAAAPKQLPCTLN